MTSTTLLDRALKLLPKGTDKDSIHSVTIAGDGGLRVELITGTRVVVQEDAGVLHDTEIVTGPPPHESIAVSTPVLLEIRTEVNAAEAKGTHPRGDTATGQNAGKVLKDGTKVPTVMPEMEAPDPSIVANFESLTDAELEKLSEQLGVEWTGQKDHQAVREAIVRHNAEYSGDKATGANIGNPDVPTVHPAFPNDFEKAVTEPEKAGYRDPDDIPDEETHPTVVGTPEAQAKADQPDTPVQFPDASLADALANPEGADLPPGDPDAEIPLAEVLADKADAPTTKTTKTTSAPTPGTVADLKARLDAGEVEYPSKANKAALEALARKHKV